MRILFPPGWIGAVITYWSLTEAGGQLTYHLHTISLIVDNGDDMAAGYDKPHLVLVNQVWPHSLPLCFLDPTTVCHTQYMADASH